ncbi:MAG TPA: hypothetical protein VMS37_07295 [Verrucomicrobiae bacterium]|nr:hypothetical protein [Verrucomicrobiae bacterium]
MAPRPGGGDSRSSVSENVCRAHLQKVTSSATFARAEQLRRLLEWLGTRSLTPDAPAPSEKEIGETVLRRRDFDPQTDSLVRKEMSRLREKLRLYYAREGARDRVRIGHAGGYLLGFAWAETRETAEQGADTVCLLILPLRSQPDLSEEGLRMTEELLVRVAEAEGAKLVSPTTSLSYAGRVGDIREFATECGADFVVEGRLDLYQTQLRATLWFVSGASGRTEKAGRFAGADPEEVAGRAAEWLRQQIGGVSAG